MKRLLINIALFVLAFVMFIILAPIGLVYGIATRGRFQITKMFLTLAIAIDQTGNAFVHYLFDDLMMKRGGQTFGNPDQTISYCLGANEYMGTLKKPGKALVWLLDKVEKDHCEKAFASGKE